ncbi:aurora kinase A-like isoform X2 [Daphnia pulicaria]|uniref:aurora kinase A-like isoform X2 n=1 Tax=Daphnia pulicaria TaxID=35523 RepID=UPI001EEB2D1F|nr:aurora kinase A-like isoform X2 [Daphnia pulicaria]
MERLLRHEEEEFLFKGKNIHCRNEPLFKGCGNSLVYRGYLKKAEDSKEEIVVRKIKVTDCCDQWNDIVTKHTREKDPIKHENVLKIISYEEMDEWRYFGLVRYDATLEQFCKGFYRGPMPSNAQVLCQITNGLLYLHAEQCSHGNLTPGTVLIASSQPVRMMIKLSEFGLSKFSDQCDDSLAELHDQDEHTFHTAAKRLKYFDNFKDLVEEQDICQRKYWILDGTTTDSNQQTPTPHQDIFSAGCLCFYFLKRGVHPFGDDSSSILENIKQRNPVNLPKKSITQQEKGIWEFAYEPIENMIGDPPTDGTNWLMIAKDHFKKALPLRFEEKKENELGSGTFGVVYRGTFEGNAVAVKVFKDHLDVERKKEQKREMEEHLRLDHENVLKLLHVDELRDKTCLVLELCAGTLTDYCEKKYNGPELPPDGIVLYQIANGLHYIHSRNLVHRDVKPDNILISMTTPIQLKLSDFGYVKKISPQGTFTQQSGLKGTLNWMAPEILELMDDSITELPHGTIQSDTFVAGCVFFYFLTGGKHPFGNSVTVPGNVLQNKPGNLMEVVRQINFPVMQGLYELIEKMIKPIEERISLPEVIKHLTAKLYASRK